MTNIFKFYILHFRQITHNYSLVEKSSKFLCFVHYKSNWEQVSEVKKIKFMKL